MVAPLIGMAARAAAKKAAEKQATRRAQVGAATATGVAGALGYDKLMSGTKADMEQGDAEGKRRAEEAQRKKSSESDDKKKKKYAKGGSVSARADGIAKRGKTNCKII